MTKQEVNAMYKQWMESYRGYGDEAVVACFFKALGYYRVSALDVADVIEDLTGGLFRKEKSGILMLRILKVLQIFIKKVFVI